jgi:hypothetical protein
LAGPCAPCAYAPRRDAICETWPCYASRNLYLPDDR